MSVSLAVAAYAVWKQRRKIAMAVLRADDDGTAPASAAAPDEPVRFGRKRRGNAEAGPPESTPPPLSFGRRGRKEKYTRVSVDLDLDDMT